MKFCQVFTVFILLLCSKNMYAQGLTTLAGDSSGIVVFGDARLAILTKKHTYGGGGIYSGRGYRVQIYSGTDRTKATQVKIDFMRRFPGVRTYMSYIQPQFRVKVGDFRSREDAAEMYRKLNHLYSPCMVVPDIVEINTLRND